MCLGGEDVTELWLTVRVRQLWEQASHDLAGSCSEFDRLVAEYGRQALSRALANAGLIPGA
jgi:hypothetical protein